MFTLAEIPWWSCMHVVVVITPADDAGACVRQMALLLLL